jgi:hypothetical protein
VQIAVNGRWFGEHRLEFFEFLEGRDLAFIARFADAEP